jgi:hypothetical protein
MRWILLVAICTPFLFAQGAKHEPNRINNDAIGESVANYLHNNPKCNLLEDPLPSKARPGQTERRAVCGGPDMFPPLRSESFSETVFGGVSLRLMQAKFLQKEGLVSLFFELRRKDYQQLKQALLNELGGPTDVVGLQRETVRWDNGVSRIDLEKSDVPNGDTSYLFVEQDQYLNEWIERNRVHF